MTARIIVYLFFFLVLILVYRLKREFIYYVPIFNVLADISFNYFEAFSAPSILRAVVLLFFLMMFRDQLIKMDLIKSMYLFFFYLIIIMLFSREFRTSLKVVMQVILSMSVFIVAYKYIIVYQRYKRLLEALVWVIVVGFVAAAVGYIFNVGQTLEYTTDNDYKGEPEFIGLLGSGGLYGPALALALLPLIKQNNCRNIPQLLLWVFSVGLYILIILNVRRTAILIPIIGFTTYLIFSRRQIKVLTYLVLLSVTLALLGPLYQPLLEKRIAVRVQQGRFEKGFVKTESRYTENIEMLREIRVFKNPVTIISGIGHNIFAEHVKDGKIVRRMYHSDTAKLAYGTGLIGLLLYFLIYGQLLYMIIKIPKHKVFDEYRAGAFTLLVISIFVSFNGSITLVTFRTMTFLLLGALLGMANAIYKTNGAVLADKKFERKRVRTVRKGL